jgi:hypothetical protein
MFLEDYCHSNAYERLQWLFPQQATRMDCCQPNFQRVFVSFCNASKCPLAKKLPNFDLKIMILTYRKDFLLKIFAQNCQIF